MRDLKHLIFMEDLLQEANNDLVKQAKAEGRRALGYTCNFMPEVLLDLAGCFSVRLRAPRSGSPDMATYYMSARTCHFGRSLMERALEGGFNFLDAQMAHDGIEAVGREELVDELGRGGDPFGVDAEQDAAGLPPQRGPVADGAHRIAR